MSKLKVWHDHELLGEHDPRCGEFKEGGDNTYHRRHEGRDLVVVENGVETRYPEWSAAGVDLVCAYTVARGPEGCERCSPA